MGRVPDRVEVSTDLRRTLLLGGVTSVPSELADHWTCVMNYGVMGDATYRH